jgi:hypothetical protein
LAHFFIGASPWCPGADEENGCAGTTLSADGSKGAGVSSAGAHHDKITTSAISQYNLVPRQKKKILFHAREPMEKELPPRVTNIKNLDERRPAGPASSRRSTMRGGFLKSPELVS